MMATITAKAQPLADKYGSPLPIIIQILQAIIQALSGLNCPPTPPAKTGMMEKWWVRRQVRLHLDDNHAYQKFGLRLADDILDSYTKCTVEEIAAMKEEA